MKFVYVLASSDDDFYVEEALLSMYTLKKHNINAEIILVSDSLTITSLNGKRALIKKFINEYVIINPPTEFSFLQKSRFIKTNLREYIKGTFLYIDNDTLITGNLEEIENLTCEVGAVLNRHKENWKEFRYHPMMLDYKHATGINPEEQNKFSAYYNGGIIYSRDTPGAHKFFQTWHNLWLKSSVEFGFHKDQPDMWYANYLCDNVIMPISGTYNFQAIYPEYCLKYLLNCKIFHYFSSAPIGDYIRLKDKEFKSYVKENGIDEYVQEYLDNFVAEYISGLKILVDKDLELFNSPMSVFGRKMSKRFPSSNKIIERLFGKRVKD
ncbi:MAG: hypothetical protein J1F38_08215 [Muribaculaceae bacterium]|nr:hypothetical protein [Muribaculaceae bacterium]